MTFLFHLSALSVLPFWFLMIFLPHWQITKRTMASPWVILIPSLCYAGILLPNFSIEGSYQVFSNPSPELLSQVLSLPWAASMMWAHVGAFDLFVGRWIYFDATEYDIHHLFVALPLGLAIFYGPLGFLFYAGIRLVHKIVQVKYSK